MIRQPLALLLLGTALVAQTPQGPPAAGSAAQRAAQEAASDKAPPAYPERDILSPFRRCDEIYAPPDALFRELRVMRDVANQNAGQCRFDEQGRELCDVEAWQEARGRLERMVLDPGYLAEILRRSRNADERDIALYGMFWCANPAHVFNLIGHIPGEPEARARERAYPRAIHFLKAAIGRRWGDLTAEQKAALDLPEPGSPAALAAGYTRAPRDTDYLFNLNLKPFFQLLDLDSAMDQAQGLWFLKECCLIRKDLALGWLEPALPRLKELVASPQKAVREQVLGLCASIARPGLAVPGADAGTDELVAWIEQAARHEFPPVRVPSEGLVLLQPSAERQAMATVGRELLLTDSIGDMVNGKDQQGRLYRGFRVGRVPDEFKPLPLKVGMVVTMVNGTPIDSGRQMLTVIEQTLQRGRGSLLVEYMLDGETRALEVRVL